jgi:acetyl-CoA synthetase
VGYPVVLKVDSPDIPHKTEAGAVRLNLRTDEDVARAFGEILDKARSHAPDARIIGVSVQPMADKDYELIVGARRDPLFGPVIMVGLGGIFVELLQDSVVDLAPVTPAQARDMLSRLRGRRLLDGIRGAAAADVDALSTLVSRISYLAAAHAGRIDEIDVNPLAIAGGRALALDALIVLRPQAADRSEAFHSQEAGHIP